MEEEQKRLNIAVVTSLDPRNRRSWSGTIYYITQALQKHCGDVTYIGPMDAAREKNIGKIRTRISQFLFKKQTMFFHGSLVSKRYGKIAAQRLKQQSFDVIVAPTGETEIAFLDTDIPIVLTTDSTYALVHNYYPVFSNMTDTSWRDLDMVERRAIQKASLLVYPSAWAANSALNHYHADEQKVHIVPFGANFEQSPPREIVQQRTRAERCRLLFIGVDWKRKGGEIAFETLIRLEEMGIPTELIVCGCTPPTKFTHPSIKVIPFLDKNDPIQRRELENLYLSSDFLLFPTRMECYGIVVCEANAFGLPAIGADTGGVSGVITDGENGFMLPYDARGDKYAELIATIYRDEPRYRNLVQSSRKAFDERLNWDVWGMTVHRLIVQLLEQPAPGNTVARNPDTVVASL